MLDDQGDHIFSMTVAIAERARKLEGTTVRSIGQISRFQRIVYNDAEYVNPLDMIAELRDDDTILTQNMCEVHSRCDETADVAIASLVENWIDESEKRTWFLFECGRHAKAEARGEPQKPVLVNISIVAPSADEDIS
jgi:starvation-inducible DNA-binding protein